MQPVALRSGWLKHLRSTSARSLDEQNLWLPRDGMPALCHVLVSSNSL